MSLMSLGARKTLAAAGVTALAAMAAAAPANAATLTQTYKCTYPLIGERGLTVNIDAAIPATWQTGTPTPPFAISASAEADLGTYQGLDLIGANKISGTSKASSTVTAPNFTLPVQVPIAIPEVTKPAAPPLRFEGLTGETPSLTFTQAGNVGITVDKLDLNIRAKRADGSAIVLPPVVPVDSDGDPNTFDVPCVLDPAGQNKTLQTVVVSSGPVGDTEKPTAPGEPTIGSAADVTSNSIKLNWAASTDNVGVTGYEVRYEGQTKTVGNVTETTLTGLTPSTVYEIDVRAKDAAGNFSDYSSSVIIETLPGPTPVDNPPSAPTGLAGTSTNNSVTLNWTAATDDKGISGYDVYRDGVKGPTVTGTTATISGLAPSTAYKFKVQAKDTKPQTGPFSTEITVTTKANPDPQPGVKYGYNIKGVSVLKTLTTGPVPISGTIDADLELATGNFTADLALNSTKANLKVLGTLPVKADIGFQTTDKTRGKLANGVLTATAKFNVRLKQLYLFGVLPIAGDGQCRTKSASIANLKSSGTFFDPLQGGNLKGTYGISDLTGCGLLEAFISPLAKGGGNTLDINLTPKP